MAGKICLSEDVLDVCDDGLEELMDTLQIKVELCCTIYQWFQHIVAVG